jgi:hypothetical protein
MHWTSACGSARPDILHRRADQPAQQEQRLLAARQHPREIVKRRLRVGPADGFVERGDEVVMPLPVLVVDRDPAVEQAASAAGSSGRVELDREQRLRLVEQEAPVAVGGGDQRLARGGVRGRGALHQRLGLVEQAASARRRAG